MTDPVFEYPHFFTSGCSVVGGFVYRGCEFPGLYGQYIFADYCSGRIWRMAEDGAGGYRVLELANMDDDNLISFGENHLGELFVAGHNDGNIYKIGSALPMLSASSAGCMAGGGTISFNIPTDQLSNPQWSDGSTDMERTGLAPGTYSVTVTNARGCTFTDSIEVDDDSPVSIEVGVTNEVDCYGDGDGSATVSSVSGAFFPYSYQWSTGETTQSISMLSGGNYTVTLTDAVGCKATAEVEIIEPDSLVIDSVSIIDQCAGGFDGSITIFVSGGTPNYDILWSNGETGTSIDSLIPSFYSVSVTDENSCFLTYTAFLAQPPPVISDTFLVNHVSCFGGSDGSITVVPTGGSGGGYQVHWPFVGGGTDGPTVNGLSEGTYVVYMYDSLGCGVAELVDVVQPDSLEIAVENVVFVSCFGESDGAISISISGGTPGYQVNWSNGAIGETITDLSAGNYTATITDANNCTATEEVVVLSPSPLVVNDVTATGPSCVGSKDGTVSISVSGGFPYYDIIWNNGDVGETADSLSAGTYAVTITDANYCSEVLNFAVTDPLPIQPGETVEMVSCAGFSDGSIMLVPSGGTSPFDIAWANGQTGPTIDSLPAGNYLGTITDANGCSREFDFEITAPPPFVPDQDIENVSCHGNSDGSITLMIMGGTSPYEIVWGNGTTGPILDSLIAGNYTSVITDDNNCSFILTTSVSEPDSLVTVSISSTPDTLMQGTGTATIIPQGGNGSYTYLWSTDPPQATDTATGLLAGNYTVTVTDFKGCELIDSVTVDLFNSTKEIYFNGKNIRVEIFPNPVSESPVNLNINGAMNIPFEIKLNTVLGQVLEKRKVMPTADKANYKFDLNDYPAGAYLFTLEINGENWLAGKVIKY